MCDKCGVDHEIPKDVEEAYEEVIEEVKALSPELRALLIEQTLTKVKDMMETSIGEENALKSKALMAVADNCLNLAGLANAHNREDHEEWTSTGDKRVDDLWDKHVKTITRMLGHATHIAAVSSEGLPDDTVERFERGEQTDEDMDIVKAAMREQGIDLPEGAEVQVHGVVHGDMEADAQPAGVGLYL